MAKHRAPRSPFWTLLGAGTIACGLTVASLVPLPTVHDTAQVATLPKGGVEVGDGSTVVCWVEKADDPTTAEGLCGDPSLRPAGAVDVGTELTIAGRPWVATVTGLEPIGAN